MFSGVVFLEGRQLPRGEVWQRSIRPNLAVRVWIARAHHLAAILENLHVVNPGNLPKCAVLLDPSIHDSAQFLDAHLRHGEIVSRRKTHHPANPLLCFSYQQSGRIKLDSGSVRPDGLVSVVKNVTLLIWRGTCSV